MKIDDIHSEWETDCRIDDTALDSVAGRIPILHSKYLRYLSNERLLKKKLDTDLSELRQAKSDRLLGLMSKSELDARGWEAEKRRYLKGEVEHALAADSDVSTLSLKIAFQQEKCDVLDSIVKMVMNRNFIVKSMIDWKKFISGAG